jgi:tRNA pseudouridine65 synthase
MRAPLTAPDRIAPGPRADLVRSHGTRATIRCRVLSVLYQDACLAAVDKPSGLAVHRSQQARERDTCLSRLRDQLGRRVWPVHRLDRGASGVLLFALDPSAAAALATAFAERRVRKTYLALARGFVPAAGRIEHPLSRPDGPPRPALTDYACLARVELPHPVGRYPSARYSLVQAQPLTGREHQLRRHLRHIDHPLVGDVTWGDSRHNRFFRQHYDLHRLALHAARLELPHPADGRTLRLHAPLPPELRALADAWGWGGVLASVEAAA